MARVHLTYGPICSVGGGATLKLEALKTLSDGTNEICRFARLHMCRAMISVGLIEGAEFSGVRSQHLCPKLPLPSFVSTFLQPAS